MIDLPPRVTKDEAKVLWRELRRNDAEREVALWGSERMVRRLRRLPAEARLGLSSSREVLQEGRGFALEAGPGARQLDKLRFVEVDRPALGADDIEVEVVAADFNFLDLLTALGQIPRVGDGLHGFSGECSGIVSRTGQDVEEFTPGDEVIVARGDLGCVASHVTAKATEVFLKPKHLTFEEASAVPIAFLTAWYALTRLAQVQRKERVLIHSATGGTGLACVQMAQLLGAEVFATAGNDEKREYLRALGVSFVASSRSLTFADEIKRATDGRGVDVIVNSLAGEAMTRSLACIAPYGRFVEIGKRDFLEDKGIGLRPFLNNLSYFGFDLRLIMVDHPERVREGLQEVLDLFEQGSLQPLPRRVYHIADAPRALRQMSRATHIGKLTLAVRESPVTVVRQPQHVVPLRGTWLLAGGLGGFGFRLAEELARRGVRSLILLGRAVNQQRLDKIERLKRETGADVRAVVADLTDRSALESPLRHGEIPRLHGVVHCAMTLDDTHLTGLTEEAMFRVVRPKMSGAWNLRELTADMDLDAFVLFSSMASMLGNPGQGNYAVGNAFLDGLAHYRKTRGLPVTCVNWGVISDAGYVAERAELKDKLERSGVYGSSSGEAVDLLLDLLDGRRPQVGAFRVDWEQFRKTFAAGALDSRRYEGLIPQAVELDDSGRTGDEVVDGVSRIEERFLKRVSVVLGVSTDKLDIDRPLIDYLDSLLVLEIIEWIQKEFGLKYTLMDIMKGSTGSKLAARIH